MLDEKRLFLMIARILYRCVRLSVALPTHALDIHRKRREPTPTEESSPVTVAARASRGG